MIDGVDVDVDVGVHWMWQVDFRIKTVRRTNAQVAVDVTVRDQQVLTTVLHALLMRILATIVSSIVGCLSMTVVITFVRITIPLLAVLVILLWIQRQHGFVSMVRPKEQYGFIESDTLDADYFFHFACVLATW